VIEMLTVKPNLHYPRP